MSEIIKRRIRLEPLLEFGSRADFVIMDITEEITRKRGTITIDYAPSDIESLKKQGMDLDDALSYYENRIYDLVRFYISGEWEPDESLCEALSIVRTHIGRAFA